MSKYWAIFRAQLLNRLAYPGDLAAQSLVIVMFIWIFMQLWRTVYNASGSSAIAGLTLSDTIWYLMMAEVAALTRARQWRAISESVKDGSIAYVLNKPYHFLLYHLSIGLADAASSLGFYLLSGGVIAWLLVGPPPSLWGLPLALLALLAAWVLDYCFSALIGLAAFVAEEVAAFDWIYSKFILLLGGVLIPLDFFPAWLQKIALALPFSYTIYGPARLFIDPTPQRFVSTLAIQLAWLATMALVLAAAYRKGAAWLTVNGG